MPYHKLVQFVYVRKEKINFVSVFVKNLVFSTLLKLKVHQQEVINHDISEQQIT